ncbi:hypothetical protein FRC10_006964, partial [Ceratobasidium sp. 414]
TYRSSKATLFSAILTAFIIESKKLLQQDQADDIIAILRATALSNGVPQAQLPVERPPFSIPSTARWINGLWFTALALSLAAGLVAMLAKEWLTAFVASRPRPPRSYALTHQARLKGLKKWRTFHIIDLLPSILHLSLLLFSLGLAIYLWTLDAAIAIAEIVVASATLIFYLGTAVSAAMCESCPFVTQISKYLNSVLGLLFSHGGVSRSQTSAGTDVRPENDTTDDELQTLFWLAENARDPAVNDCAYQALAGLSLVVPEPPALRPGETRAAKPNEDTHSLETKLSPQDNSVKATQSEMLQPSSNRYTLIGSLFHQVCTRLFEAKTLHRRELMACQGLNVARYCSALSEMVRYLQGSRTPLQFAFNALDSVWSNDCPEFSPDAYTLLTAAEIRLIEAVVLTHHSQTPTSRSQQPPAPPPSHHSSLDKNDVPEDSQSTIDMRPVEEPTLWAQIPLHELRARYSRALARAGALLTSHGYGLAPIGAHSLAYLFESIRLAAQCTNLNPTSCLSTSLPQSEDEAIIPTFRICVIGTGKGRYLHPMDIGNEDVIIAGLVKVMSAPGLEQTPWVELAAGRALAIVGPVLFHQWREMIKKYSRNLRNQEAVDLALGSWPKDLEANRLDILAEWTLSQLLRVAIIAVSEAGSDLMSNLPNIAISALYHRVKSVSGPHPMYVIARRDQDLIQMLAHCAYLNYSRISPTTLAMCLRLFLIENSGETLLRWGAISPMSLPTLLHLLAKVSPQHIPEVQLLFKELRRLVPLYLDGDSYLAVFTRRKEGFTALAEIAAQPEYALAVMELTSGILEVAAGRVVDKRPCDNSAFLSHEAIPQLLYAVRFVVEIMAANTESLVHPASFMRNVVTSIERLDTKGLIYVANHPATANIHASLRTALESHRELAEIVAQWEEIQCWADTDGPMLGGFQKLFDAI